MSKETINVSRRDFLIRSTAGGAGFVLGLHLPLLGQSALHRYAGTISLSRSPASCPGSDTLESSSFPGIRP